jgi:outer membrane protein assembly factor BamB
MDGSVHAVDAATGAGRWEHAAGSSVPNSPVVANGAVYVVDAFGVLLVLTDAPPEGSARASPPP